MKCEGWDIKYLDLRVQTDSPLIEASQLFFKNDIISYSIQKKQFIDVLQF